MMLDDIESAKGKIDDIYYCPHGWNDGCDCRKPKPGLLYRASRDHAFQLDDALFIGDDERDEIAGLAAGCKPVLTNELLSLEVIVDTLLARGADYTYLLHLILKAKAIKPKVVIAIAGQSRAGKSTIAETIKRDLLEHHNIQTQVLALDNFIISLDKRPTDSTVRSRYDYRKINETIEKICNGESVQLPYYDSRTRTTKQDGELFSPISQGVILVEGVVALDAIDDAQQIDIKVYVTTDEVARKQRFREFYTIHKLLPAREVDELIRERYRDEFPIVHNSIQNADLLIRN
jgi:uridine kinase